jgi:hypothetical protein
MFVPEIALLCDLIGTFCNAYGFLQMKIALQDSEKEDSDGKRKSPWCNARWLLCGFGLILVANIIHIGVLPFCDMSLLTTTCSLAILFNCYLSIKLLGETFSCKYDLTAALLICAGSLLTIFQMNTEFETIYTRVFVQKLLLNWNTLILIFITLAVFVMTRISYKK